MTNEEIVTRLKRIADHAVHIPGEKPFVMSLDDGVAIHEAIEMLSQQTADAISRQEVHETIVRWAGSMNVLVALPTRETRPLLNSIHELPSVTAQPKTGHWISHRKHCENLGVMPSGLGAYEWCSNCDCGIDVREWHMNNYNYCPNCGCRMVEPQESE